jgi:hypothetical protein
MVFISKGKIIDNMLISILCDDINMHDNKHMYDDGIEKVLRNGI